LRDAGWDVAVGARTPLETEARFVQVDRCDNEQLAAAIGDGVDVLVDVIAFTAEDACQLVALAGRVGSVVAISSAGVYEDEAGRSLDTQETGFPQFPLPVAEGQRTVSPGEATYATRKVAMEGELLESDLPSTVLRPCAVHGPGSAAPRELYFTKRALDGRKIVLLSHRGETRFHTTSVANLAELVWLAAERPGTRVLNCGDPDPPTVLEIARAIAAALNVDWPEVLLPGQPPGGIGETPWSGPASLVLSMQEAELELRYQPVTTYAAAVVDTVRWLVEARPQPTSYMTAMFDYASEDRFLADLPGIA
jgi:nucleoside-diphosphate-sugar epimerase